MNWLKLFTDNSPRALLLNMLVVLVLTVVVVLSFFYLWLPGYTRHDEQVIVPDLGGLTLNEAKVTLEANNLMAVVSDSNYKAELPPTAILNQYPSKEAIVKPNRKIYLTINRVTLPTTRVPNIIDGSLKNAQLLFKSFDLKVEKIEYVNDIAINAIQQIFVEGKEVTRDMLKAGFMVPKGTAISLKVGNGLGRAIIDVPDLLGRPIDEVEELLIGLGLKLGKTTFVSDPSVKVGHIRKQYPESGSGRRLRVGNKVDVWVVDRKGPSSIEDNNTESDTTTIDE